MEKQFEIEAVISEILDHDDELRKVLSGQMDNTPSLAELIKDNVDIADLLNCENREDVEQFMLSAIDVDSVAADRLSEALVNTPSLLSLITEKIQQYKNSEE